MEHALPRPIAEFVPHAAGMCLLDTLVAADDRGLTARLTPRADDLFAEAAGGPAAGAPAAGAPAAGMPAQGIPGWVGLEWLAQAVAAWAGWHAARHGEAPAVGFLVGSRRYFARTPRFQIGRTLEVRIRCDFAGANGLGQFSGEILDADDPRGAPLAEGWLTLYQPEARPPQDEAIHDP
ncbi:ApeP family dehydratase [Modicisalibacter radicis]|uniref:ApeP family dehydratase n=1 Tax=Halomonas sp. EAR18 TaxID=2518972 RepID=UPI001443DD6B|nr:hypothetical protein [Halomonas sp. EAR18]